MYAVHDPALEQTALSFGSCGDVLYRLPLKILAFFAKDFFIVQHVMQLAAGIFIFLPVS